MKRLALTFALSLLLVLLTLPATAQEAEPAAPAPANPRVAFETNLGTFVVELSADKTPKTVENFLGYVESGFFAGTIFHRVIPGFMAQGGGYTEDFQRKSTRAPVENEADKGLRNDRGTIAMARTGDPHSATAQFFVNLVDNDYLNFKAKNANGWGYTAFGRIVEGMDVVDRIAAKPTTAKHGQPNAPVENIVIKKATVQKAGE